MKVLVPVKRVIDYNVRVRVKADQTGVETQNVKMSINPFDEIAVEAALQLKQAGKVTEVIAVTIGEVVCQDVLRHALAMGADRGILVTGADNDEPLQISKILHKIVAQEQPNLVIMGKQAIDNDCGQVAQMLAGLMDCAQATFASNIELSDQHVDVQREVDGGLQTLRCQLPAVISTDLRLNEPRYVTLPNIMKAKAKPIATHSVDTLGLQLRPHSQTLSVEPPSQRQAGVMVSSVDELMDKLHNEAGVL